MNGIMKLDHFAYASSSLDKAIADFEDWTGVRPTPGGSHPGKGTRNALVSLGPGLYLALDAPDPAQRLAGNNGAWMAELDGYFLFLFAVATDDIERAQRVLAGHDVATTLVSGERRTGDGRLIAWDFLEGTDEGFGIALPHVMRWKTDHHPSVDSPAGCRLASFTVQHPDPLRVRALYAQLGLEGVEVRQGAGIALSMSVKGSRGDVTLPSRP